MKWEATAPDMALHLRPGVKFSDGTPFTADDVVFSFDRIRGRTRPERSQVATSRTRKDRRSTMDFVTDGTRPDPAQELTGIADHVEGMVRGA